MTLLVIVQAVPRDFIRSPDDAKVYAASRDRSTVFRVFPKSATKQLFLKCVAVLDTVSKTNRLCNFIVLPPIVIKLACVCNTSSTARTCRNQHVWTIERRVCNRFHPLERGGGPGPAYRHHERFSDSTTSTTQKREGVRGDPKQTCGGCFCFES